MAEEHGFESPEGHRPCANNCGFFGSPATQNFCSKCYGDVCMKQDQPIFVPPQLTVVRPCSLPETSENGPNKVAETAVERPNRCSSCRKKVGLMGFRCRCGTTFCGTHRYPEQHTCTFDFKAAGREAIARDNPLVIAQKLDKI